MTAPNLSRIYISIVLFLSACPVQSQEDPPFVPVPGGPCIDFKVPGFLQQSSFGQSTDAPMYQILKDNPVYVAATQRKIDFLNEVDTQLSRRNPAETSDTDRFELTKPCNYRGPGWDNSVKNYLQFRGFAEPKTSCITDFAGTRFRTDEDPFISEKQLLEAIRSAAEQVLENLDELRTTIVSNWSGPGDVKRSFAIEEGSARCTFEAQGAVRIADVWYVQANFQSTPLGQFKEKFGRQVVSELHTAENGKLVRTREICIPKRPINGTERVYQSDFTTVLGSFRGSGSPTTFFVPGTPAENPAVVLALNNADEFLQQADDATTPSNIAIIMLPLALNLVPIALVADVSTTVLLAYALLSDVLTVIPLGIKGVELIMIGNQAVTGAITRMSSSSDQTSSETAGAELWVAECRARDNVKPIGIVFLCLAIVFLIGGVSAEFIARDFASKRRARRREALLQRENVIPGAQNALLRSRSLFARALSGSSGRTGEEEGSGGLWGNVQTPLSDDKVA